MRLLIILILAASLQAQVVAVKHRQVMAVAAPTAPTLGTLVNGTTNLDSGFVYNLSAVTATAGDALFVGFGYRGLEAACDDIASITSNNGSPTFVETPSAAIGDQSLACAKGWIAYGVAAGSHALTLHGTAGGTAALYTYVVVPIHPGSLSSVTDASCSGHTGTTSAICSGSMTPSTSLALMGAFAFCWDAGTFTAGGSMTIPANGQVNGGSGTAAFEYQVLNPPSGSYTPSFTAPSGGDGVTIVGFVIK